MGNNNASSICSTSIKENYCSKCGQYYSQNQVTVLSLIIDFFSNFFSLEKSGFATIYKVIKSPKFIIDNYFNGYKNYFASPGKLLLYGIATIALHHSFINKKILGLYFELDNAKAEYLFWIVLFPILIFISYLSFYRAKVDFSKHAISILYVATSLLVVCIIANDILIFIFGDFLAEKRFYIYVFSVFFWNSKALTTKNKFLNYLNNTLIQSVIFISFVLLLFFIAKN